METERNYTVCILGSGWKFTSGISYYTHRLAVELAKDRSVSVVLLRRLVPKILYPGRARVGLSLAEVTYPRDMAVYDGVDWFWGLTMLRALRFVRRRKPDVLVVQWWSGAVLHSQLLLALAARRWGSRLIIEFHETQDTGEAKVPGAALVMRILGSLMISRASDFVVHSEFDRAEVSRTFGLSPAQLRVIPHGPYDHHSELTSTSDHSISVGAQKKQGRFTFLFFGTIRPYKGLELLVDTFNNLSDVEVSDLHLLVVGETWENWGHVLNAARAGRNASRITIVNRYVSDIEVSEFFDMADVVVLPYTRSSASGPLHIAMSRGLPVILTAVGGLQEAAQGYAGISWIEPGSSEQMRDALLAAPLKEPVKLIDPRSWQETRKLYESLLSG